MNKGRIVNIILILGIVVVVNVIANMFYTQFDLTEDRRFTLTDATVDLLKSVDKPILVKVLLEGDFPAGFKRLQEQTGDILSKYHTLNSNIDFEFENPTQGPDLAIKQSIDQLKKDGISPVTLTLKEKGEMTKKPIYPYAIFSQGAKRVIVNILEEQVMGVPEETILNNSISLLEYKFSDALQKLFLTEKPLILFTEGRGELGPSKTASMQNALSRYYKTERINLDSIYRIDSTVAVLVVARPRFSFDDRSKFLIDQYVMHGGKVIWLIDYMDVTIDSINLNRNYIPPQFDINLDDLLFKYGVRFQPNLVLDIECTTIPQVIGSAGGKPQIEQIAWPYHLLVSSKSNHPIVNNIDRVNLFFPSTIDTVQTKTNVKKSILLQSSPYTMYQFSPVRLSFDILKIGLDSKNFNKPSQNLGVLLEGEFESLYKNRVSENMLNTLKQINAEYRETSLSTKQLVIADGDFIVNQYEPQSGKISPMGYNRWDSRYYKGNGDLIINAVEYMMDNQGVLASRSKEVKLRLLNKVKVENEKTKWRAINIIAPLLLLLGFGLFFNWRRKKKYAA